MNQKLELELRTARLKINGRSWSFVQATEPLLHRLRNGQLLPTSHHVRWESRVVMFDSSRFGALNALDCIDFIQRKTKGGKIPESMQVVCLSELETVTQE